jgi:hypothetical protein
LYPFGVLPFFSLPPVVYAFAATTGYYLPALRAEPSS